MHVLHGNCVMQPLKSFMRFSAARRSPTVGSFGLRVLLASMPDSRAKLQRSSCGCWRENQTPKTHDRCENGCCAQPFCGCLHQVKCRTNQIRALVRCRTNCSARRLNLSCRCCLHEASHRNPSRRVQVLTSTTTKPLKAGTDRSENCSHRIHWGHACDTMIRAKSGGTSTLTGFLDGAMHVATLPPKRAQRTMAQSSW